MSLTGGALAADLRLYSVARTAFHGPRRERALRWYSTAGEHAGLWLALGSLGAALDAPRRRGWVRATAAVAVAHAGNSAVKRVARRPRPALDDLPALVATVSALSFPSSHASSSFAAARAYSALLPAGPLYVAAAAMAASRVYLGAHYPSDVVAGALLGTAVATAVR